MSNCVFRILLPGPRSGHAASPGDSREALLRNGGQRLASARTLGMHKSTFFRKTRRLGISLPEHDGRARRKPGPTKS